MDVSRAIEELLARKAKIERAIHDLEQVIRSGLQTAGPQRRGRKSMPPEERLNVSARMRRYWANRRKQSNC